MLAESCPSANQGYKKTRLMTHLIKEDALQAFKCSADTLKEAQTHCLSKEVTAAHSGGHLIIKNHMNKWMTNEI